MTSGLVNPNEPHQIQIWISSASDRNTYAYDKTIEILEQSIINPKKYAIFGCDYRVPMKCGLLPKDFLNELKSSTTFDEADFSREYMSRFIGNSSDSWFNYDRIMAHRKLVNYEVRAMHKEGIESFYVLGVDVGRRNCQSVCVVLKVYPRLDGTYKTNVVNIFVLGKTEDEKVLDRQCIALKRIIRDFAPRQVVLDINGIGVFLADAMIKPTFDAQTGETLPAYGFSNREEYFGLQPRDCAKIIYGLKATSQINSDMHSFLYSRIDTGRMNFLITEKEVKAKIMATKIGQRMTPEQRNQRLVAHQLTTHLVDELMNLKVKPSGANNQIAVEQINKRIIKDKFSALEMANYYVALTEQEATSRRRNRGLEPRQLVFYRAGGGR